MGHTLAEKIIAAHVVDGGGVGTPAPQTTPPKEVWPGDLVETIRLFHTCKSALLLQNLKRSRRTVIRWH